MSILRGVGDRLKSLHAHKIKNQKCFEFVFQFLHTISCKYCWKFWCHFFLRVFDKTNCMSSAAELAIWFECFLNRVTLFTSLYFDFLAMPWFTLLPFDPISTVFVFLPPCLVLFISTKNFLKAATSFLILFSSTNRPDWFKKKLKKNKWEITWAHGNTNRPVNSKTPILAKENKP